MSTVGDRGTARLEERRFTLAGLGKDGKGWTVRYGPAEWKYVRIAFETAIGAKGSEGLEIREGDVALIAWTTGGAVPELGDRPPGAEDGEG